MKRIIALLTIIVICLTSCEVGPHTYTHEEVKRSCEGYVVYVCYTCGGKKTINCPSCEGKGVDCSKCAGKKKITCTECNGSGEVRRYPSR